MASVPGHWDAPRQRESRSTVTAQIGACTGEQASVGVAGHRGLWGKRLNSDTELGLDIHCFFLKSRKAGYT